MDRKTLEYMDERVKKAKKIFHRIGELTESIEKVRSCDFVIFDANKQGSYVKESSYEFVKQMRKSFVETATQEIVQLEKELAEL